ncbi:MAG: hypothetical protein DYG94_05320 [Leptolyngbya sp. PLA3]|nr:MAG: hypothetical protein EDM82_04805 [Cyanobacteria bacterium CYA]MCE7968154.1 hypothetical protein [Leptolyngbya sp. PL-A3]
MLAHSPQVRNLIAVFVAVMVPFCCCNLRGLLGAGPSCEGRSASTASSVTSGSAAPLDHREATHSCCQATSSGDDEHAGSAPKRGPADERGCTCDKSGGKMLSGEQIGLEIPPQVAIAVIEWLPFAELRPIETCGVREPASQAVERPQTSLVRMHCALIV